MMMKRIILGSLFVLFGSIGFAQQLEQFSMYMENNFLINPAEAGTTDYVDVKLGYRTQWLGLEGAPKTYFLSAHTPIGKKTSEFDDVKPLPYHGAGVAIIGDRIGPYDRTVAKLAYSYQKPLTQKLTVSAGVHAGIQQVQFNADLIERAANPDALKSVNSVVPDLSFGLWGHTKNFYFGLASFQLIPAKVDAQSAVGSTGDGLKAHHWLTSGIRIPLDSAEHWNLIPSLVVKYVPAAPVAVDINTKLRYKDTGWLGVSYRHGDAVVAIVGVTLKNLIEIAYSYDIPFSTDGRNLDTQSHEILLGLRLPYHDTEAAPPPFW